MRAHLIGKCLLLVVLGAMLFACQPKQETVYVAPPPPPPQMNPVDEAIRFFDMGNYAEAKRLLTNETSRNTMDPRAFFYLGRIYLYEKECPSSIAMFKQALVLNPNYYEAQQQLTAAQKQCGQGGPKSTGTSRSSTPSQPKPREVKEFKGGAKAIDPADF